MQPWSGPSSSLLNSFALRGQGFFFQTRVLRKPAAEKKPRAENSGQMRVSAGGVFEWRGVPAGCQPAVEIYCPLPSQGWKMEGRMRLFCHQLIPKLRAAPSDQASLAATRFSQVRLQNADSINQGKKYRLGLCAGQPGTVCCHLLGPASGAGAAQGRIRPWCKPQTGLVPTTAPIPTVPSSSG